MALPDITDSFKNYVHIIHHMSFYILITFDYKRITTLTQTL